MYDIIFNIRMPSNVLSARQSQKYSKGEKELLKLDKSEILIQISRKEKNGNSKIYPNQDKAAKEVIKKFKDKKNISTMVLALTQSGKTGTMISLIKNYLNVSDSSNLIPIGHIYVLTGLSSTEWVIQTKDRLPECIQEQVYHRDTLTNKFVSDIKDKKNVLIIIDEIQIAAKKNQSLHKCFEEAGLYNKQKLFANDIKIIEFTATPDGTIYDLINWGENGSIVKMEPGKGYTSCFDLLKSKRVLQYKDLCCFDKTSEKTKIVTASKNISEIKEIIKSKFKTPRYHLIRSPTGDLSEIVINNFKKVFGNNMKYRLYNKENEIEDINNVLSVKPNENEFIFIKEKLRCSKTLHKEFLGIVYERYTQRPDDAVIIQGLLGRGTGYDDNGCSIYFTNIASIHKYKDLWDSGFTDTSIKWNSKTTNLKNKILKSKQTFNDPVFLTGSDIKGDDNNVNETHVVKIFKTFADVKGYVKKVLKKKVPLEPKKNKEGFYITCIRGSKSPKTLTYVKNNSAWGIKTSHRIHACYTNLDNKSTLRFVVSHI